MSSFEDGIWEHLAREHGATQTEFVLPKGRRAKSTRRRLATLGVGAGSSAAAVALAVTVFGGATPAYAFQANSDGTATVSLSELSTGIPALNQMFAQYGIRETVVPIEAGCTATTIKPGAFSGPLSQTVTVGNQWIPTGYNGFLAAQQMPDGQILMAMGTMPGPVPSCFPASPLVVPQANTSTTSPAGTSGTSGPSGTS